MCDTNLKFGPEWLRALTEPQIKNCEEKFMYTPALANMKLAEFRYGKEEMLALFSPELDPPKELLSLGALYVDSCQFPLNLTQMGAEEARAWQHKTPEIMGTTTNNRTFTTGPPVVAGGRAQSMLPSSRGRGRGRTASFPYFDRNRFDDPDSDNSNGVQQQTLNGGKLNKGEKGGWSDSKGRPIEGGFSDGMRDWRDRKGGPVNENTKVWGGAGAPVKQGPVNGHSNSNMNWRSQERNGNPGEPNSFSKPRTNDWSGANNTAAFRQQRDKGGNFQPNHHLPEWATNSSSGADGGFDDNGKFRPDEFTKVDNVPKWTDDEKWIEEEVEPEIINQQQPTTTTKPMTTKPQPSPKDNISPTKNIPNPSSINPTQNNAPKPEDLSSAVSQAGTEPPSNVESSRTGGIVPTPSTNISTLPSVPAPHLSNINNEPSFENVKWTYLDPQGQIQGPFQPEEMLEWSTAGYFPNDLLIKRNIDGRFIPLSEMSRVYGRNPFTAGPSPRGISNVETNEHINQQQYLHHLLMQQQQQQLLAQQQLLMLHHQNSNLNSMLLNKAINPALMKPGAEALLSGVGKQTEEKLTLPMRNQNFDLSPEISTSIAPSFDPIKSLLNQLKESNNSFLPPADEKESSISPQHVQQPQHQMAPQMQHQQAPLGHQQSLSQTLIPAAQVQMSQEHQRSAMQFNQQQQATTMAIDQQLQAQLAAIGVKMSQPAPAPVQVDPVSRLQETVRQESLEVNQADMIGTEKRQSIPNQKGPSPVKSFKQVTPSPSEMKLELKGDEMMVVKEEVESIQVKGGISKEPVIVFTPGQTLEADSINEDFQVPKNNEKKEKKSRKYEIKKKAKKAEAKVNAPYIPGLPGSQQPQVEPTTPDEDRESQERQDGAEKPTFGNEQAAMEAVNEMKEVQAKPAPWANCLSPESKELSIHDIQKIEAEKEKKRRIERQQVMEVEQRERRKIEQEQRKMEKQSTWSTKTLNNNVKSLAEIQAEEEKNIRKHEQKLSKDQQTAAVKSRKAAQRAPEKPTSWAGKIAANIPAAQTSPQISHSKSKVVVPTAGFWEHGGPSLAASASAAATSNSNLAASNNTNSQKNKEKKQANNNKADNKVDLTKNFQSWCRSSLESLNTDVDIETFMGFLQDIESPYEVNDYIKSYIGEGKAHKKFASDYLEKRSQLKNALKKNLTQAAMDDLTSPAAALGQEFQEAPRKGKKKTRNSKTNLNHLLGFTSAPGTGMNRGELDVPM